MTLFAKNLLQDAETTLQQLRDKKMQLVTAESCTGGMLSTLLTEISGASDVFDRGFIAYSNDAKMTHLNVSRKTIIDFGSVSAETCLEMAEGALRASHAQIAVALSGIAGPDGGTDEKPVGLVFIALSTQKDSQVFKYQFKGGRTDVRLDAVAEALTLLQKHIA